MVVDLFSRRDPLGVVAGLARFEADRLRDRAEWDFALACAEGVAERYRSWRGDASRCWYCGGLASGVDHVPPLSAAVQLSADEAASVVHVLVPCCLLCNAGLGRYPEVRLSYRVAYLMARRLASSARGDAVSGRVAAHRSRLVERWLVVSSELVARGVDPAVVASEVSCVRVPDLPRKFSLAVALVRGQVELAGHGRVVVREGDGWRLWRKAKRSCR